MRVSTARSYGRLRTRLAQALPARPRRTPRRHRRGRFGGVGRVPGGALVRRTDDPDLV